MENGFLRHITEYYILEAHVAPQGNQPAVRLLPGPAVAAARRFGNGSISGAGDVNQRDLAFVCLGSGLHDFKHPLRACDGGEDAVHLLADLADGLADLPGVLEIEQQGA